MKAIEKIDIRVYGYDCMQVCSTALVKAKEGDPEKAENEDEEIAFEDMVNPIVRGMIKDWDVMEDLWRYIFYTGLGWEAGNEGQVLFTEPLLTPKVQINILTFGFESWQKEKSEHGIS